MFTAASSHLLLAGRQLALPLPLVLLPVSPAARAQALTEPLADLHVYPNPAHIRAMVQVPAVPGADTAIVTLTDALGTTVFEPESLTEAGGTAEVPLLGRAPGLYRVQVRAGAQRVVRTLKVE